MAQNRLPFRCTLARCGWLFQSDWWNLSTTSRLNQLLRNLPISLCTIYDWPGDSVLPAGRWPKCVIDFFEYGSRMDSCARRCARRLSDQNIRIRWLPDGFLLHDLICLACWKKPAPPIVDQFVEHGRSQAYNWRQGLYFHFRFRIGSRHGLDCFKNIIEVILPAVK